MNWEPTNNCFGPQIVVKYSTEQNAVFSEKLYKPEMTDLHGEDK